MCYRTGKYTVCRRVRASFSPEILQAVAVKGLIVRGGGSQKRVSTNIFGRVVTKLGSVGVPPMRIKPQISKRMGREGARASTTRPTVRTLEIGTESELDIQQAPFHSIPRPCR